MPSTAAVASAISLGSDRLCEGHEPDAILHGPPQLCGHLQRQPGLPHAAQPGQRDEPILRQQTPHLGAIAPPADKTQSFLPADSREPRARGPVGHGLRLAPDAAGTHTQSVS